MRICSVSCVAGWLPQGLSTQVSQVLRKAPRCGGILTSLSEGGLQHLAAGARASAGVKSGRYMFEVTIGGIRLG